MANHKTNKTRRHIIKTGAASLGLMGLGACGNNGEQQASGPAINSQRRSLTMVTTWPKSFPGAGTGAERFARRVEALSDNRITIRVYAAGELVPPLQSFDAVSGGNADMYHGAEYYWQGRSPAYNFFASVPFGMSGPEAKAWVYFDGGQELWDEVAAPFNIKPLMAGNTGTQMGGWFNKRIESVDDFRGLRMRIPGLGGEVLRQLGGTPVTRAGGEIFLALNQGNIDAAEWIGPWNDLAFGFQDIARYYYYPGFHEPGSILGLGINKGLWEDLSPQDQEIFKAAAAAENDMMLAEYNANNARALKTLVEEHGVELLAYPDDVLRRMVEVSAEVLQDTAASDPLTGRVYDSFMASLSRQSDWGEVAEQAIARARRLVF